MARGLRSSTWALVGMAFWAAFLGFAKAGKLLAIPMDGSHWLGMREMIQELSLRGHESVVLAPELSMHIREGPFYTLKTFPVAFSKEEFDNMQKTPYLLFETAPLLKRFFEMAGAMKIFADMEFGFCTDLVSNKELMKSLEQAHYDAVLTDPVVPCGAILAQYLSIPAVYFFRGFPCDFTAEGTRCPDPSSYIPRTFTENTDHMTFLQRVKNIVYTLPQSVVCHVFFSPFARLASELLQRDMSIVDVLSHGSVWLLRSDFLLDYPRPIMPNTIFIGGMNCKNPKQLSQVGYVTRSKPLHSLLPFGLMRAH